MHQTITLPLTLTLTLTLGMEMAVALTMHQTMMLRVLCRQLFAQMDGRAYVG